MDIVNEKTTYIVTLTFKDEDGNAVTPTSGTYRLDDVTSGDEITGDTAFSPASSTHDITITATENAILDTARRSEIHRLTVTYVYSGTKQGADDYLFEVINLAEIT